MTKDFTNRQGGGQKLNKLKRKSRGVIALEVCFTLPVVVYLIFFTIELIKINITQDALQSICEEITYMTIAHDYENGADLIKKGDAIVEKYRPAFIPEKGLGYKEGYPIIRWVFESYPMFEQSGDMLSKAPYGGSTITYPHEDDRYGALHACQVYYKKISQFVPACGIECPANPEYYQQTAEYMQGRGLPDNRVFTLTVTCNYPFSNGLVKMLFNGGVNTYMVTKSDDSNTPGPVSSPRGTMYILWTRGAGIVNAK